MSSVFCPPPANKALFVVIEFYLGYRICSLKNTRGKLCPPFWSWGDWGWVKKNLGSMKQPGNRARRVGISVLGGPHNWIRQNCGLTGPVLVMVLFCFVLTMMAQIMKYYILRRLVWALPGFRKNGVLKGWVGAEPMPGRWEVTQEVATGWEHLGFDLPFNLALCFKSFFVATIME